MLVGVLVHVERVEMLQGDALVVDHASSDLILRHRADREDCDKLLVSGTGRGDPTDEVFGERVCVYVVPRREATITLDGLRDHLSARGVSKEWWPEHLVVVDDLPRSSGGKVAKGDLRSDIKRRLGVEG